MTTPSLTPLGMGGCGMGVVRSRAGAALRTVGLGLTVLLVALALAGCWWDSATTEPTARESHTATLLSDGRVLIAGGIGISSAELYGP